MSLIGTFSRICYTANQFIDYFMPILQYKCLSCNSEFEQMFLKSDTFPISCVSCGEMEVERSTEGPFSPNKLFCPKDREFDKDGLSNSLINIVRSDEKKCDGCKGRSKNIELERKIDDSSMRICKECS